LFRPGIFEIPSVVMRALPILAAILCTAPFARGATSELELLQSRCQEYERQIRQLEEENSRLKSLSATAAKTPAPIQAEAGMTGDAAPKDRAEYGIVRNGDTLRKLAKRHGTTPETLAKLNKIKNPSLIRAGQKLILPEKSAAASETAGPRATASASGTHKVKQGETLYSIARHYGLSVGALQAANPGVKAADLQIGQSLRLGGKAMAASHSQPAAKTSEKKAAETAASKPAPAAETKTESSSAPANPASQTVTDAPRIRSVAIDKETEFAAFAAAHGTSTAKLNALNGLNLNSSTVLAKGSELYVPAQP
jgi:LysM repeat protein